MSINEIWSMGGYGKYVWTTYSITLIVFSINILAAWQEKRKTKHFIKAYLTQFK